MSLLDTLVLDLQEHLHETFQSFLDYLQEKKEYYQIEQDALQKRAAEADRFQEDTNEQELISKSDLYLLLIARIKLSVLVKSKGMIESQLKREEILSAEYISGENFVSITNLILSMITQEKLLRQTWNMPSLSSYNFKLVPSPRHPPFY